MIIQGKKLSAIDPIEASRLTATHGYLIIEDSGATPEEYAEWSLEYGYQNTFAGLWFEEKGFKNSEYFMRVTTDIIDGTGLRGPFAEDDVDWHSDLVPHIGAEEIVGFYGKTITFPTETWICTSIPYFQTLSKDMQEFYKSLSIMLWPGPPVKDERLTNRAGNQRIYQIDEAAARGDTKVHAVRKTAMTTDTVKKDMIKSRDRSKIQLCPNIEEEIAEKFGEWRTRDHKPIKLVPDHPLGIEGLFFQPYEITKFVKDNEICTDSKEIYDILWNELVCSDLYTYKHKWKEGDIMLSDQTTTIHRRPHAAMLEAKGKTRELLRSALWYKAQVRNHFNYVL
jgi:hypothetical protein